MRTIAFGMVIGSLALAFPASADMFSTKNQRNLFSAQTRVLDTRAKQQYANSIRLKPPTVYTPSKWGPLPYDGVYQGRFVRMARRAARRNNVPEDLFLRLVQQESNWDQKAVSSKGALGLAQLMPDTASDLGVDPAVARQNLDGGARYLAAQYREFGTWQLALAAYNAGPAAVRKYGGVPPYKETRNYIVKIWGS